MNSYLQAIELFGFVAPEDDTPDWDTIEAWEDSLGVIPTLWEPDDEPMDNPCDYWNELCIKHGMFHLLEPEAVAAYFEWGGCEDEALMVSETLE